MSQTAGPKENNLVKDVTIGLAGLAAGALIFWLVSTFIDNRTPGKNSPIKVVGGSAKFKSKGGWKVASCAGVPCLVSLGTLDSTGVGVESELPLPKILASWAIVVNVYDQYASTSHLATAVFPSDNTGNCTKDLTYQGVDLCTTSKNGYVTSKAAAAATPFKPGFAPDAPWDTQNNHKPYRRYRYQDQDRTCCAIGDEDYRESIAKLTIYYREKGTTVVQYSSYCSTNDDPDNGECKVFIGN